MARPTRFERVTFAFGGQRSITSRSTLSGVLHGDERNHGDDSSKKQSEQLEINRSPSLNAFNCGRSIRRLRPIADCCHPRNGTILLR
jgi:hypothetical protein